MKNHLQWLGSLALALSMAACAAPTNPIAPAAAGPTVDLHAVSGASFVINLAKGVKDTQTQRSVMAFNGDLKSYNVKLFNGATQVAVYNNLATDAFGNASLSFINIPPAPANTYTLYVQAYDVSNRQVNVNNGGGYYALPVAAALSPGHSSPEQFNIPLITTDTMAPSGALGASLVAQSGPVDQHSQTPDAIAPAATAATAMTGWGAGTIQGNATAYGRQAGLSYTNQDLASILASAYNAFSVTGPGDTVGTFIGTVKFTRAVEAENPGAWTITATLTPQNNANPVMSKKFFLNPQQYLVAVSNFAPTPSQFQYVDVEQGANQTYFSEAYPTGVASRHFFYLNENNDVYEMFLGAPNAGLLGSLFPDNVLGFVSIQRL